MATVIPPQESHDQPEKVDKTRLIVNQINKEFKISTSAYDPSKYTIEAHNPELYPYGVTLDTVYWYMKGIGTPISKTDLRTIIREPNFFPPSDPIKTYFDRIRGTYQGKSHIDLLCSHIGARVLDENKPEGYYQDRMVKLIRKWMVACIGQWLADIPNDIALGFISANERIGKTYLTKYLLPEELKNYYVCTENNDKFYLGDFFTRYMIICFDELVGINRSKSRVEEFKKYMRDTQILVQRRTEDFPVERRRLSCAMFTSNLVAEKGGFLKDNYGYSRFGTIEVDTIDKKYSEICDKNQLWAEALLLFENSDFDFKFDNDIAELTEYNERYQECSNEAKYVIMYTRESEDTTSDDEWMNANEFLTELKKARKIQFADAGKLSVEKLGYAFRNAGYQRLSKRKEGEKNPLYRYNFKINL